MKKVFCIPCCNIIFLCLVSPTFMTSHALGSITILYAELFFCILSFICCRMLYCSTHNYLNPELGGILITHFWNSDNFLITKIHIWSDKLFSLFLCSECYWEYRPDNHITEPSCSHPFSRNHIRTQRYLQFITILLSFFFFFLFFLFSLGYNLAGL